MTGSVGKTTTKEMLRGALSAFGPTHAAVASYNNHWGVPLTLARTPRDAQFCVAEIGMNHAGEIAPLARLARPHVAVITTVAKAHVGHLGSIEAIADEKASIMRGLEPGGIAVLPADSPQFPRLRAAAGSAAVMTFGTRSGGRCAAGACRGRCRRLVDPCRYRRPHGVAAAERAGPAHGDERASPRSPPSPRWAWTRPTAIDALEAFVPLAGRGARRDVAVAPAARRCCWTKATTATAPRCGRRWTCCGCSRRGGGSRCWATCWNWATKGRPNTPGWPRR